jgi:hypothetical protein
VQDEAIELEIKADHSYPILSRFLFGFEVMLYKKQGATEHPVGMST